MEGSVDRLNWARLLYLLTCMRDKMGAASQGRTVGTPLLDFTYNW